jgi:predicted secreted protein
VRGKAGVLGAIGATALLALGVAACSTSGSSDTTSAASPSSSPTAAASTTNVSDTALPQVVHARVGDTINVMLHSNASTGYQWVAQDLNDAAVLKQEGDGKVISPKTKMVGAPGHTQFTFTVMKEGVDEIGFWYQPPGSGPAGATWALVVKASAGHVPVNVDAGEDYTAETAQLRTGDNLLVTIDDASNAGRHSWQMIGGAPLVKVVSQKFSHGTQQMTFAGVSAGTGTLVLVNRPNGDPPLQTYAVPLAVKAPKAPVTIQLNKKSDSQNVLVKGGDTIQVALQDQPSTDFQWTFQKPNAKVLKQVGKPKFFADSSLMGSKGKMVWTFSVVGAGKTPLIANYQQVPAQAMPVKTWQVNVAAKPGFTPKTVAGDSTSAADSVHVLPGDQIKLKLASSAGTWSKPASSKQLVASQPAKQGKDVVISFTAKGHGVTTPVMVATGPSGYPAQAYAFSATVGKGKAPIAVDAAERKVAKPIEVSAGQAFDIAMESNTASTGYQWVVQSMIPDGVVQQAGDPTTQAPSTDMPGASGATVLHFKAVAAGSAELVLLYQPPGAGGVPGAVYMTMVNVK